MDPIGSLLLGKALDAVLRGGKAAANRFFTSPPTVRLLWLLYEQHGEEADLGREAFVAWDVDALLRTELEGLIDGRSDAASAPSILAPLIEPYLIRTPPAQRRALAESIAHSAARAAPYVVDTLQEATGAIVSRTERIGEGLLAAMNARDRDGALTRALVRGPLEITGLTQTAADAQRLAETGESSEAADRYLEVAAALDDHQLAVAAEAYRERAAMLLYEAGDPARAAPCLVEVGRARARRGSDLAGSTARALREAPGAVAAIVDGVEALHDCRSIPAERSRRSGRRPTRVRARSVSAGLPTSSGSCRSLSRPTRSSPRPMTSMCRSRPERGSNSSSTCSTRSR
ncbi:MAG: hypothetical protein ACRDL0_06685 [Thermoleophilaceae bacterium]